MKKALLHTCLLQATGPEIYPTGGTKSVPHNEEIRSIPIQRSLRPLAAQHVPFPFFPTNAGTDYLSHMVRLNKGRRGPRPGEDALLTTCAGDGDGASPA
jgi:hypothetical protein